MTKTNVGNTRLSTMPRIDVIVARDVFCRHQFVLVYIIPVIIVTNYRFENTLWRIYGQHEFQSAFWTPLRNNPS